jgi:hypothetical protein
MEIPNDRLCVVDWPPGLGSFLFYFDDDRDDRWTWSPQVARMHGYQPGTVTAGIELTLSHIHPDDYLHVAKSLNDARRTRQPFSSRHRIIDTRNCTREVVMIGAPFYGPQGIPVGIQGCCLDMTPAVEAAPGTPSDYDHVAACLQTRADTGHTDGERCRVRDATRC